MAKSQSSTMALNYKKWRHAGSMPKSSPEVLHCSGTNGAACGHIGEGILVPSEFVKKPEKECCPACWEFGQASGFFQTDVKPKHRLTRTPQHIPRTIHAEKHFKATFNW